MSENQVNEPGPDSAAREPDEGRVRQEEDAAAAEAAKIGGRSGLEGMDEAQRAGAEAGGGEAEGFEQAEKLLEEQATHAATSIDPLAGAPAAESERDPATHGDADEVESTETEEDTQGTRPPG